MKKLVLAIYALLFMSVGVFADSKNASISFSVETMFNSNNTNTNILEIGYYPTDRINLGLLIGYERQFLLGFDAYYRIFDYGISKSFSALVGPVVMLTTSFNEHRFGICIRPFDNWKNVISDNIRINFSFLSTFILSDFYFNIVGPEISLCTIRVFF
jgi:hypothetical protein